MPKLSFFSTIRDVYEDTRVIGKHGGEAELVSTGQWALVLDNRIAFVLEEKPDLKAGLVKITLEQPDD